MEFGKHIGKGVWAFADKALPAIYGVGFIFLVIRVLPEKEYGAFVIIQTIFTIVNALGYSLAHQPLTKFAAESEDNGSFVAVSLVLSLFYVVLTSALVLIFKGVLSALLDPSDQGNLLSLVKYLPLLFFVSTYRSFAISLLQASYQIQKIFWIDSLYFIGTLLLVYLFQQSSGFHTASDLVLIVIIAQGLSSSLAVLLTKEHMSVRLTVQRDSFIKLWNYGKYTFGGNSLYTIFSQTDVFFVSVFTGVLGVAVYNASKIFTRLFDMVAQVLQMFLVPFSSKAQAKNDNEALRVTAEKAICFSTVFSFPLVFIMLFYPEMILDILYKGKYTHGASILRVFGFLGLTVPWSAVASSYIVGLGEVKKSFYIGVELVFISVILYSLLTPPLGAVGTTIGYVTAMSIITLVMVRFMKSLVPITLVKVIGRTKDIWIFFQNKLISLQK